MDSEIVNGGASDGHNDLEAAVLQRYGDAAQEVEACLCLPVSYDKALLKVIPDEIIAKDYGCGDPSRYVRPGETVLDLGSGSGKTCLHYLRKLSAPRAKSSVSISIRRCWSWRANTKTLSATRSAITTSSFAAVRSRISKPI